METDKVSESGKKNESGKRERGKFSAESFSCFSRFLIEFSASSSA
jgi:hypothetical protein